MVFSPVDRDELVNWLSTRGATPLAIKGTEPRETSKDQLVMSGLNRIVLYEPDEMIVQCEAGITLLELQRILAEKGQWIPTLQASETDSTTVGGSLSED